MKVGDLVRIKSVKGKPMGIIVGHPKPSVLRGGGMACDVLMFRDWKIDGWAVRAMEIISENR